MKKTLSLLLILLTTLILAASCAKGPDDSTIATEIKAQLYSDPDLKALNLNVAVQNGEVTLNGNVPSAEAQLKAFKLASAVPGVTKVNDQMRVQAAQVQSPAPTPEPEPPKAEPPVRAAPRAKSERPAKSVPAPPPLKPEPAPGKAAEEPVVRTETKVESPTQSPSPTLTQHAESSPPPREVKPQPVRVEIAAGTNIAVRTVDSIDSSVNREGEVFRVTLDSPITVDGEEVVPERTELFIRLARAKSAGRMAGRSELELELSQMEFQGRTYQLTSNSSEVLGKSRGKDTALKVGIGAGIGTAIGAISGGGKGAAIGAAVGGGAGAAIQVATRGEQVRVPPETLLSFRLESPVTIIYTPAHSRPKQ